MIANTATLRVGDEVTTRTFLSNEIRLITGERLDVTLTAPTTPIVVGSDHGTVPVVLTNTGNGDEIFVVTASPSDASATVRTIAIDTDGDGAFDPAGDRVLVDGRTPSLAPGATLALLVVLDAATSSLTATSIAIAARVDTGSGAPGMDFDGRGDGGGDAQTGTTGGAARVTVPIAATDAAAPTLVKQQSVRAPDGSTGAVRGATITYVLDARFPAATAAARLRDPIPAGTRYVAGSLRLDSAPLTDAADDDAGTATADGIDVTLGDIAAPATHTIQFQVTIQ